MANSSVTFKGINDTLDISPNTSPININDQLVRVLSGNSALLTPNTKISFSNLLGRVGVGPLTVVASNSQGSFLRPVQSSSQLSFRTDIYNPVVNWSYSVVSGCTAITLLPGQNSSSNAVLTLNRTTIGAAVSNVQVTASLSYGNSVIGSNTAYVNLSAEVYDPNLVITLSPSGSINSTGYQSQTAIITATATSNVPSGVIKWSVSPNNSGITISGNTVILRATSSLQGVTNASSYFLSANVFLNNTSISGVTATANVSAVMYSNTFVMNTPSDVIASANVGPVQANATFSASANAPSSVIVWSATANATISKSSNDSTAASSFTVGLAAVSSGAYGSKSALVTVTANMYSDNTMSTLISSKSANVVLAGIAYGLNYTPPSNVVSSGYSAQTAIASASASYEAGTFTWSYSNTSGIGAVAINNGSAGTSNATWSLTETQSTIGSNTGTYTVVPVISYLSTVVSGAAPVSVTANATQYPVVVTLAGPASNTQYANNGDLTVSSTIAATIPNGQPAGSNIAWTVARTSGSANASITVAANAQSANLYFTIPSGSFLFSNGTFAVTANVYSTASNTTLASNTISVYLRAGTYGLSASILPANNTQASYAAQTATANASVSVQAGTFAWRYSNTSGSQANLTVAGTNTSSIATISTTEGVIGSNVTVGQLQALVYAPGGGSPIATVNVGNPVTLTATFYDPAVTFTIANGASGSFISPVTANATISVSSNVSGATYTWSAPKGVTGSFSNTYTLSSNTEFGVGNQANAIGTVSGTGYVTCTVYDSSSRLVGNFDSGTFTAAATVYNPALVATGPTSNTTSNTFTANATIQLTASSNANIPTPSYVCTATRVSGNASVNITSSNSVCTLNVSGRATTNSASYTVSFSVYSNGTLLQTINKSVTLSSIGTVPAYALSVANGNASGFNFAQTAVGTCSVSNLTGGYATWVTNLVSGATPSVALSGTGNNTISTSISQTTVGNNASVVNQTVNCYSPDGYLMQTLTSNNYSHSAVVYNPAFNSVTANANVFALDSAAANGNVQLSANSEAIAAGATYSIGIIKTSGDDATNSIANTDLGLAWVEIEATSSDPTLAANLKSAVYSVNAALVLNSQIISGPVAIPLGIAASAYNAAILPNANSTDATSGSELANVVCNYAAFTYNNWSNTALVIAGHGANNATANVVFNSPANGQVTLNISGTDTYSAGVSTTVSVNVVGPWGTAVRSLDMVANTVGTGIIHMSRSTDAVVSYTTSWTSSYTTTWNTTRTTSAPASRTTSYTTSYTTNWNSSYTTTYTTSWTTTKLTSWTTSWTTSGVTTPTSNKL